MRKTTIAAGLAALLAVALTACSSGGSPASTSGEPSGGSSNQASALGRGPITYAQGKDVTGKLQAIIDEFNAAHPDEKVTFVELPEKADDQRSALVQDFQAGAGTYDVAGLDVTWTAEFAARDWLLPLDDVDTTGLFASTVASGTYNDTLYAAPYKTNIAFLFYRSDLVEKAPITWDELIKDCEIARTNNMGCYAGQYAQYEGLTVNFSEAVNSAGGALLDAQGNASVNTSEAQAGLAFLINGFKDGYIPEEAITYQEEESRRAFQAGELLFLRNWPYVYNLAEAEGEDSVIQGKFSIATIPGGSGLGASTLGGYNLAISKATKNPATAQDFINYMLTESVQKRVITEMGEPPVRESLYDDAELRGQIPYFAAMKEALANAVSRPLAVSYTEFSEVISTSIYKALQDKADPKTVLDDLQTKLQKVIDASK
ncbi:MAG: ABC transporter substrate-binding protein [Bifidobacteriaceae bacterium]|jgi:multiple sugar transport system substrate-binding protein|nr:ABC transporter substrate-binding protein [Bifidobacteriaceae bacterium]